MALGFVLGGYYLNLIVFTSLILIHELGHYLMAKINRFKVEKIIIYPYGGMTKISDMINRDINEELLIASFGVIFQYLFYLVIGFLHVKGLVREYTYSLYTLYSNQMIFFNLFPIYPLDGGKILNLILGKFLSYYLANMVTIVISIVVIIVIIIFSIYECSYSNVMVMGILFMYLYKFFVERKYLYQRFLLERYLYNIRYPKVKIIGNVGKMFKNRSHIVLMNGVYVEEKRVLNYLFGKKIRK